jgi:hypothetical protein
MVYYQPIQKYIKVNGHEYVFIPRNNVSLAEVQDEDVATLSAYKEGCNCASGKRKAFYIANDMHIRIWEGATR